MEIRAVQPTHQKDCPSCQGGSAGRLGGASDRIRGPVPANGNDRDYFEAAESFQNGNSLAHVDLSTHPRGQQIEEVLHQLKLPSCPTRLGQGGQ